MGRMGEKCEVSPAVYIKSDNDASAPASFFVCLFVCLSVYFYFILFDFRLFQGSQFCFSFCSFSFFVVFCPSQREFIMSLYTLFGSFANNN